MSLRFGAEPLFEPMIDYYRWHREQRHFDKQGTISLKSNWKRRVQNGGHFIPELVH